MESELVELAQLRNSRVKGHHAYRTESRIGDEFRCEREVVNRHSEAAIVVISTRDEVMGHIPNRLAQTLSLMLDNGYVKKIVGKITGPARSAPEGVWRIGGGIELPCQYVLYGRKKDRADVRSSLRQVQSRKRKLEETIEY